MRDDRRYDLIEHGSIWVLELNKFAAAQVETERERRLKFFKEAERFDQTTLPDWMHTAEMRQAMSSSSAFSERERAYHAYKERQEFLRQQRAIQCALDEARAAKEAALPSKAGEPKAQEVTLRWKEVERRAREAALQWKEAECKAHEAILQAKEMELQAKEARRKAKDAALAEVERLTALLEQEEE